MKGLISALVILLLVGVLQSTEAASCACATTFLNVRSGAGTGYRILHTMKPGECLPYYGYSRWAGRYKWFHLKYRGQHAWAASYWLRIKACSSIGYPRIITRAEWGARTPSRYIGNMAALPRYVFIHHGASSGCSDRTSCTARVKSYQNYHMNIRRWSDIAYNFLVGEDGNVYEGRGWKKIGGHTYGYNRNSIAICVIGNFNVKAPNTKALNAVRQLIKYGLDNGKIPATYTLKGHRDVGSTSCPGTYLYNIIKTWPHYRA